MSYRLVDSNAIAIKYPEVNDMDCIYADLKDGLDNKYHIIDDGFDAKDKLSKVVKEMQLVIDELKDHISDYTSNDLMWLDGFNYGLKATMRLLTERIESVHNVI